MTAPSSRRSAATDVGIGLRAPSPEQLGTFVCRLQRLLTGGEFVSTYKLALLIALARWAIEHPDHDERQPLDVSALAGHFVELYWPHVLPFHADVARVAEARPDYGMVADSARCCTPPASRSPECRCGSCTRCGTATNRCAFSTAKVAAGRRSCSSPARNLPHDLPALQRVAASLYSLAEGDECKVWREGRSLIALTPEWRRLLGVA